MKLESRNKQGILFRFQTRQPDTMSTITKSKTMEAIASQGNISDEELRAFADAVDAWNAKKIEIAKIMEEVKKVDRTKMMQETEETEETEDEMIIAMLEATSKGEKCICGMDHGNSELQEAESQLFR